MKQLNKTELYEIERKSKLVIKSFFIVALFIGFCLLTVFLHNKNLKYKSIKKSETTIEKQTK